MLFSLYMYHRQPACAPPSPLSSANVTPSSSPVFGPADSSPPSSPIPYSLDSPPRPSAPFTHPFAASTKANKRLPDYEKKIDSPPCTPPGVFTLRSVGLRCSIAASRSLQEDDFMSNESPSTSPPSHRTSRYIDREERIWDDALRRPFDTGNGQIDLSNQQLKYIPPSIGDLSGFFNTPEASEQSLFSSRAWARVNTEPVRTRPFERTQSIQDSGKERHVLKLYLMGNLITSLPPELFTVKNLTVLSLRNNNLTFIPPEVALLTNLHELNIANNQLKFLPWQMRDMKIDKLMVNPNPFFPVPEPTQLDSKLELDLARPASILGVGTPPRGLRMGRSVTRLWDLRKESIASIRIKPVLSPVTYTLAPVPPLTELCLRLLLASASTSTTAREPKQTVLVEYYGLPLSEAWSARVPPSVRRVLGETVPGIIRTCKRVAVDMDPFYSLSASTPGGTSGGPSTGTGMGTGTCPNPTHKGQVFIKHACERFSWERRIAGVDVGGAVPLRWRGCMTGCVNFLEEEEKVEKVAAGRADAPRSVSLPGPHIAPPPLATTREEDSDTDVGVSEKVVQAVDLTSLDMDDFDD